MTHVIAVDAGQCLTTANLDVDAHSFPYSIAEVIRCQQRSVGVVLTSFNCK